MNNPLLSDEFLPLFQSISAEHVVPAVESVLDESRAQLTTLLASGGADWQTLVEPLELLEDRLSRVWSPVSHLNSVKNSPELRDAYNAVLPALSEYQTEVSQNQALYAAIKQVLEQGDGLDSAQRKLLGDAVQSFELSGVGLPDEQKQRYAEIVQSLSQLQTKFEENVLDATQGWFKHITDKALLAGVPDTALAIAEQAAQQRDLEGWVITLDFPSYFPILTYADNAELREEVYIANVTRASDHGPNAGEWDNTDVIAQILALRHEVAQLLGFANYAEYSLATKMANNVKEVTDFLEDLASRSKPQAARELEALRAFAKEQHGVSELNAWDVSYYAEKLRLETYAISQEALRPYFPADDVVQGLFSVVAQLFGLKISQCPDVEVYHEDVKFYEIRDAQNNIRGSFYLDLYARENKRGGAWMDVCRTRYTLGSVKQQPVAYLTCNASPPTATQPALFTHDDVVTLFHEFGHGLHHMLTKVDYPSISGISGVEWDAVELPSQFLENWCWEKSALDLFAKHYQTGEALSDAQFDKMLAARNFQSGMMMVRQIEFSLFDMRLHAEYDPNNLVSAQVMLDDVRSTVSVFMPPAFNRFQNGFSHIFAGGYAAGYYSYKWAEVLSADAYSAFEETGVFDTQTGERFVKEILEMGGSRPAEESFVAFRGRKADIAPLLRHCGIQES